MNSGNIRAHEEDNGSLLLRQAGSFLFFLLLFLISSSIHLLPKAEGRPNLMLQEATEGGEEMMTVGMAMIGSRPPRCQGRCLSCGQCEAVQVPAIPQAGKSGTRHSSASITTGGDDSGAIYKPLSWKCKCGGVILNP